MTRQKLNWHPVAASVDLRRTSRQRGMGRGTAEYPFWLFCPGVPCASGRPTGIGAPVCLSITLPLEDWESHKPGADGGSVSKHAVSSKPNTVVHYEGYGVSKRMQLYAESWEVTSSRRLFFLFSVYLNGKLSALRVTSTKSEEAREFRDGG